jgi:hypothetical protein
MHRQIKGNISMIVLIFGVTFASMAGGLALFGSVENNNARRSVAQQQALAIAEAGVNYYRWHLAHDPDDYQDGTGQPGPYVHQFDDPEAGISGTFTLEITPPPEGSEVVTISSTGQSDTIPGITRTITAKFGPEPLTRFSFLHNASVWFGQGLTVYGEVFSNGGIRFDGINESVVGSSRETYICGSETGCSPSQTKDGVWGSGGPSELWEYPVPVFDFDGVVTDFNAMRTAAQSDGVYYGPSGAWGYHVVFDTDGTFDVYRVTSASSYTGYSVEDGCHNRRERITGEQLQGTYNVDDNLISYFEDTVWIEGQVRGHSTVVAARLPTSTYTTNMYINGNIEYGTFDGSDNLGIVAQNNIYYVRNIPNDFIINAAMMAQSGRILRRYYGSGCGYSSWRIRNSLTIYGSVISNQKSYWNFSNYSGLVSGFNTRDINFNQNSADQPPPYFPSTENVGFLSWDEN